MKIILDNGFFKFYPDLVSDIARFEQIFKTKLVLYKDFWIPQKVYDLKRFYAKGEFIGIIPILHTADNLEDLFHKNDLTYNFLQKSVAKISIISNNNNVGQDLYAISSPDLIEAGSYVGSIKVKNYQCVYNFNNFYYTGVSE